MKTITCPCVCCSENHSLEFEELEDGDVWVLFTVLPNDRSLWRRIKLAWRIFRQKDIQMDDIIVFKEHRNKISEFLRVE